MKGKLCNFCYAGNVVDGRCNKCGTSFPSDALRRGSSKPKPSSKARREDREGDIDSNGYYSNARKEAEG